jgi:hypothetical protein
MMCCEHGLAVLMNVSCGLHNVAPSVLVREREEAGQQRGEGFMVLTTHVDSDDALHCHCVDDVPHCFHPSSPFIAPVIGSSTSLFFVRPHSFVLILVVHSSLSSLFVRPCPCPLFVVLIIHLYRLPHRR